MAAAPASASGAGASAPLRGSRRQPARLAQLLLLMGLSSSAAALVSYDIGALDGSMLVGTALLAAADKWSLLRAAGLDGLQSQEQQEQVDTASPYTDFAGVGSASDSLVEEYEEAGAASSNLPAMWDGCAASLAASSDALGDTWVQGIRTTAQGLVAAEYVSGNVGRLAGLGPAQKQAALATLAAYDTYLKSGGGRRAAARRHRRQQVLGGDGGGGGALLGLSPLLNTYQTLKPYVAMSPDCTSLFRELAMQRFANGNGPMASNGGGSPGGVSSPGGMPGQGLPPTNPLGSSMSGQEPPNPFDEAAGTEGADAEGNPLDGATSTAGQEPGAEAGAAAGPEGTAAPEVGDQGTNRCKTFSSGGVGVQLCQGTTTTESAATVTGSVINVGQETLCGLALIIDSFELSSSYYPNWLPKYEGLFMPGDTITFGVTVPYTQGTPKPQADVDASIAVCAPPTASPTAAATNVTQSPTAIAADGVASVTGTDGAATTPGAGAGTGASAKPVDWLNVGGVDTACLKGCQNLVEGLSACEAFDTIGSFRCDVCNAAQFAAVKQVCLDEYGCGEKMCHIEPAIESQSSGAGRRAGTGGNGSVRASLSLLLGFLTVALLLNMG